MKSAGLAAPADTVIAADAIARDVLGQAKEPGKANIGSELNCVPFELLGGQTPSGKPSCQGWALRRDKVVRHNHGSAVGHGSKPQFLIPARIEHSQSRNSGFRIGLFGKRSLAKRGPDDLLRFPGIAGIQNGNDAGDLRRWNCPGRRHRKGAGERAPGDPVRRPAGAGRVNAYHFC